MTVRRDGSVNSYWPNGDLAVTVDLDHAASCSSPKVAAGLPLYRMFAMYRQTGNVAASFETGAGGGFVQVGRDRCGAGSKYLIGGRIPNLQKA